MRGQNPRDPNRPTTSTKKGTNMAMTAAGADESSFSKRRRMVGSSNLPRQHSQSFTSATVSEQQRWPYKVNWMTQWAVHETDATMPSTLQCPVISNTVCTWLSMIKSASAQLKKPKHFRQCVPFQTMHAVQCIAMGDPPCFQARSMLH